MLEYYAMLCRKYPDLEIEQYVTFIGDKKPMMPSSMKRSNIAYQFSLISLLDIDYKIFLQNENPDEAIFAILANYGNEKPEIIVNYIIQQIQKKNVTSLEQQKCYEQLRTLANLRNL